MNGNWNSLGIPYFKPIKIQVQTDECMYTSNQFSQKIQAIFPDQVTTVSQNYKGSVDIIITTSNVYKTDNCSVLIWKPVPNTRDWQNLVDLLDARVMEIN